MKRGLSAALTAAIMLASSPVIAVTMYYDRGQFQIESSAGMISGPGFDNITVARNLSLPAEQYLVPLDDHQSLSEITYHVTTRIPLAYKPLPLSDSAQTTSDDESYDRQIRTDGLAPSLGRNAVEVLGETEIGGHRYAEIILFPLTVDSSGELWLNEEIEITLGTSVLGDAVSMVKRSDVITNEIARPTVERVAALSAGTEYLIVTSSTLADAAQRLVRYKNETGYSTDLVLIEDILVSEAGRDDAERLRNYLRNFYDNGGTYVLLVGDATVLPIRYAYHYNAYSYPDLSEQQVCDLYFADMNGDWDVDNDGVWGERYHDQADLTPELRLGRLPVNTPDEASSYIDNLIQYETDPGGGRPEYLTRTFFFSSDQMRDYGEIGQHATIAEAFPPRFTIDTVTGVEAARGDDPEPYNLPGSQLGEIFAGGFGIVHIVAHGRSDGFVVRSSGYNQWPKSYLFATDQGGDHGCFDSLAAPDFPSFYYSLACDNGAFDLNAPPLNQTGPGMAKDLIGNRGGAVGFIAYSRWGWISSSHLLQKAFFDSLFAHPERPAVEAMYASKVEYYYYRDLVYGQNYFGDPTLRIYTDIPKRLDVGVSDQADRLDITVTSDGAAVPDCMVVLSADGVMSGRYTTDQRGCVSLNVPLDSATTYRISAAACGATVKQIDYSSGSITAVDDDNPGDLLPDRLELRQNYPNPFNPSTTIVFDLPRAASVRLTVYNSLGQEVATLADGDLPPGEHSLEWNGSTDAGEPVATGVYFYRLVAGDETAVRKMILLR